MTDAGSGVNRLYGREFQGEYGAQEFKRGCYTTLNHTEEINYYRVYQKYNINYI